MTGEANVVTEGDVVLRELRLSPGKADCLCDQIIIPN